MRALLIGGPSGDPVVSASGWEDASRLLGQVIGQSVSDALAICTSYQKSADAYALNGFAAAGGQGHQLFVYHPEHPDIAAEWRAVLHKLGIKGATLTECPGPDPTNESTRSNAYFLSQLKAMRESDVIVAVGGRNGQSAHLLLSVAAAENRSILPYDFAGGAAREIYRAHYFRLANVLGEDVISLSEPRGVQFCLAHARRLRSPSATQRPYVFISYSWRRQAEADAVESELRRRGVDLFRDETSVEPGGDFPARIAHALNTCTHFIGLWCAEYACSPHCFDEFHHAIERQRTDDALKIIMFCLDETRYAWKAMRSSEHKAPNWPRVADRQELRAALANLFPLVRHMDQLSDT